jgi:hypothetical protein
MKKIGLILFLFLFLFSCATPHVVNIIGPNDTKLTCDELSSEIEVANNYANDARKAKSMKSPTNVGAILFFLPGLAATMENVEKAEKAAESRSVHLSKIKDKKNCK